MNNLFPTPYDKCVNALKEEKPLQEFVSPEKQQKWCEMIVPCLEKDWSQFRKQLCLALYPIR